MTQAVVIKSKSYGIQLVLNPECEFEELTEAVIQKFRDSGAFFKDARLGISFEGYGLTAEQQYELIAAIEDHTSVNIVSIIESDGVYDKIKEACLLKETEALIREKSIKNAVCHYGSLQPGESLYSDTGLVIIGDVPKGAKAVAGGSITVFGTLGGLAQAGAYGDPAAYIAALSIEGGQVQIGSILFIPPETGGKGKNKSGFLRRKKAQEAASLSPQIARVQDGHVIMEPYTKDLF